MSAHHLPAARRRIRKEQLARRHGQRCTYCRRPFASLREATLDHIVPVSLFRTWSVVHLTLACVDCNHAKADRLSLSIALLLVWTHGPDLRDEVRHTPRHTDSIGARVHPTDGPFTADRSVFTDTAPSTRPGPTGLGPQDVQWLLLARLVHARTSDEQSPPDQANHRKKVRREVRVGRLEHARRMPRLNTCEQPTDRGVSA